jgi:hypothetical protein
MTMMDDADASDGGTVADDVASELASHNEAMNMIMSEHGMAPDDEGSQTD